MAKDEVEKSFLLEFLENFLDNFLGELRKILKFEGCYLIITTGDYGW